MLFYFIFIFSKIFLSKSIEGIDLCSKYNPLTKLCIKCKYDIYTPDTEGGCQYSRKCELGANHCIECLDGKTCKECDIGYFPDENGGCSMTNNCEISYKGQCLECKQNYVLVGLRNYYQPINDYLKICKPLNSDDLLYCKSISYDRGNCLECEDGYYNTGDKKCSKTEYCSKASFGVCKMCIYGYYLNKKQEKCIKESGNFVNCKISNDGIKCDECKDDFFFDDNGKCVFSNFCADGYNYQCKKCREGYYITAYQDICTTEKNCYIGRKDIGICTQCIENYCIDFKDGKCKSNLEDNDFKYCRTADGKCTDCISGKYLGQDKKCSNSINCEKSEKGICIKCIDNFYLGLDNLCSNVENCIYSDENFNCSECKDNYYYNRADHKCKIAEGKLKNCKYGYEEHCEKCKTGFYLNNNDNLCYSNKEQNDFYKCEIREGDYCILCIEGYFLGNIDQKCSKAKNCDIIENENRCKICSETYCLDSKNGFCIDNDYIYDIEKIFYFRCNKTNSESTECEVCLEGYELRDGLCFDEKHCKERNKDGKCTKCQKMGEEHYEQCLSDIFGCVEGYYDVNCLECNDLSDVGECTGCMAGFELDNYNNCVSIKN